MPAIYEKMIETVIMKKLGSKLLYECSVSDTAPKYVNIKRFYDSGKGSDEFSEMNISLVEFEEMMAFVQAHKDDKPEGDDE